MGKKHMDFIKKLGDIRVAGYLVRSKNREKAAGDRKSGLAEARSSRIFITGDKHRDFSRLIRFCKKNKTTPADIIILLGDAGFNYYGDRRDIRLKRKLARIPVTLLCIHGNKENRPEHLPACRRKTFCGGPVYFEEKFPNILFARDCGIYVLGGREAIVLGGAHSVDRLFRREEGLPWWPDEVPGEETRKCFEEVMQKRNNKIDYIFTHTAPLGYEPTEMFIANKSGKKKKKTYRLDIDKSLEKWLDTMEQKITYEKWFCGHYHTDKQTDRLELMFHRILPLLAESEKTT